MQIIKLFINQMNKLIFKIILFLFLTIFLSCEDEDSPTCTDSNQIIDDCGICRDSELSEDWNATMDDCGICNGNNSSCSACMDETSYTFDETAQFHDCTDCQYGFVNLFIIDDGNGISLKVDDDVTMYPGNLILIRSGQNLRIVNQLNENIVFSLDECLNQTNSCNDSCIEYDSDLCDYYNGCKWDDSQNICITDPICNTLNNEDCDNNSDCFWQNDITATPHEPSQGLYLVEFNYSGTFDYSVTIPWIDYTINGSVIVNDYEN